MDTILIQELEVFCHIGVTDAERQEAQRLLCNLELTLDITTAAAKDELRWSIDYGAVCARLIECARSRSWSLIETLAVDVADLIMLEFQPASVVVEIRKFSLPQAKYAAVRVARSV